MTLERGRGALPTSRNSVWAFGVCLASRARALILWLVAGCGGCLVGHLVGSLVDVAASVSLDTVSGHAPCDSGGGTRPAASAAAGPPAAACAQVADRRAMRPILGLILQVPATARPATGVFSSAAIRRWISWSEGGTPMACPPGGYVDHRSGGAMSCKTGSRAAGRAVPGNISNRIWCRARIRRHPSAQRGADAGDLFLPGHAEAFENLVVLTLGGQFFPVLRLVAVELILDLVQARVERLEAVFKL
jgi:hypothetical protein